ncbi:polysaccharide pyruvyl transferase family protein [Clostridium sp. NSJ-145]|uniref:polysaccharide pyruvyl transferase family protein n=1 Tax=Clostridium sp. NSJ-145 TaxID=2897777 RepID=UPI001E3E1A89|nr:polysaccharide pyruvyl transferase family protein [Clostridium sp. NSJ-145]MCD2502362.1 polysaccharide pyruvyl transferase family protein [Clostridium sp. NSJ-145]
MDKRIIKSILGEKNTQKIKIFKGVKYKNLFKEYKDKKKIIYMLLPSHGNIGDQAIALATLKYLKDKFNEFDIIEIYREDTYKYIKAIKQVINDDDIIILHGGGNMGNLYPVEEQDRRAIINLFPKNKIISMTQTISFSNDIEGDKELQETKETYNKHKDLTLIAREKRSYEIMKNEFDIKNIILNPDIVLYLNGMLDMKSMERKFIMTCLRSDKESILGNKKSIFISKLNESYTEVFNYDTVVKKSLKGQERIDEVNDMFNKFMSSKLVITDRLHGMVFAAITKTPCIVTKSLDHKVVGTYEWIKDLNYIRLVNDLEFDKIKPIIEELISLKEYTKIDLNSKYFDKLKNKIL